MRIPESKISEIAGKLSISEVVSDYVDLTMKGNRYWGLCPFHSEKTPSFTVNDEKDFFYCFGCHKGGSMFSFVSEIEKIPFPEAVKKLADKAGVQLPSDTEYNVQEDKKYTAMMELYSRLTKSLHFMLVEKDAAQEARAYLEKRGIDLRTQDVFQLGYVPDDRYWVYNFLSKRNYSDAFLKESGLFSKKNPKISLFSNRIMFPVIDTRGNTVAFSGRQLGTFGGKYINTPETFFYRKREMMFGLFTAVPEIRLKKEFILVEGNFDVCSLYQAGCRNAVAPLGTAFTEAQGKILRRYARKALIFFDNDSAGVKATLRAAAILEKLAVETAVIEPSGGEDPADILQKQGPEALNKLLKYPINTFEYIVKRAVELYDTESPEGKRAVFDYVAPYISSMESAITREGYLKNLAEKLHVNVNAVINDFSSVKRKNLVTTVPKRSKSEEKEGASVQITPDLYFMLAVAVNISVFSQIRSELFLEDFTDVNARNLFIAMEDLYRREELTLDYLMEKIENKQLKDLINEKNLSGEFDLNFESIISDGVRTIKRRSLELKRKKVVQKLDRAEFEGNLSNVKQLLSEKIYLDEELNKVKVNNNV